MKPGQVPATSLVPPGPENGGGAHINPGSETHFRVIRLKSKSVTHSHTAFSQISSVGFFTSRLAPPPCTKKKEKKKKEAKMRAHREEEGQSAVVKIKHQINGSVTDSLSGAPSSSSP